MSMILAFPTVVLFILGINLGLPRLFKKWQAKPKLKSVVVYFISLALTPVLGGMLQFIINESLKGRSGGFEMIGVGLAAGLFLVLNIMLFGAINFFWFIVRLLRDKSTS